MKLAAVDVERLTDVGNENPIVWERNASRCVGNRVEVQHKVLTRRDRDGLVAAFGEAWLAEHLRQADAEIEAWKRHGVH